MCAWLKKKRLVHFHFSDGLE